MARNGKKVSIRGTAPKTRPAKSIQGGGPPRTRPAKSSSGNKPRGEKSTTAR